MSEPPDDRIVRDMVAQIYRAHISRRAARPDRPLGYGWVMHGDMSTCDVPVIRVVTQGGESLPLTARLCHALSGVPAFIYGEVPALIDGVDPPDDLDQPISRLRLTIAIAPSHAGAPDDFIDLRSYLTPRLLTHAHLVCLSHRRPPGWPR